MTWRMTMDAVTLPAQRADGKYQTYLCAATRLPTGNPGKAGAVAKDEARSRSDIDKPGCAALNGARHQLVAGDDPIPAQTDLPRTISCRDLKDACQIFDYAAHDFAVV